jgi:hypothetical protein
MTPIILATLETRHFSFDVLAVSRRRAEAAMRRAWAVHAQQTGAAWTWADVSDDVSYREMTPGTVYRDGEPLPVPLTITVPENDA